MVIAIFRSRIRSSARKEYDPLAARMLALAEAMPGFRSFKSFRSEDGERLSLIEFESEAQLTAWRDHPEHRQAQEIGRERIYSEYSISVCEPLRNAQWSARARFA